jgi:hypothetical protein
MVSLAGRQVSGWSAVIRTGFVGSGSVAHLGDLLALLAPGVTR